MRDARPKWHRSTNIRDDHWPGETDRGGQWKDGSVSASSNRPLSEMSREELADLRDDLSASLAP